MGSLGENPVTHEWWQTYSGVDVTNEGAIYAKSSLQFCGTNVTVQDTIVSDENIIISASNTLNTPEDGEVNLYSPNGNISIYAGTVDLNGVIYAPNGIVQICASDIKLDGMIIAKEIQISAQDVVINQNLNLTLAPYIQYYNEALQIMAQGSYSNESQEFTVNWETTFEEGIFDIYTSTDNLNYSPIATVQDVDSHTFSIDNTVDSLYIKVIQTLDNGFSKESNVIRMAYDIENGYVMADDDTDGEGLTDFYEYFLETDKNNIDTDGDGLSDYAEVYLTLTDPLYKDSNENGILDGDEDPDGDGLTNLQEIQYGTDPHKTDTDEDGISDYDEVFVYGTYEP